MEKINLEEILIQYIAYYSQSEGKEKSEALEIATNSVKSEGWTYMIKAMKEACKQTLELAAEKAKTKYDDSSYCGNTGSEYEADIIVNKQSILNVINLIK